VTGAEASDYQVHGVDNNEHATFFGPQGDAQWNRRRLLKEIPGFIHHELDVPDCAGGLGLLQELRPSVIVHTAAQELGHRKRRPASSPMKLRHRRERTPGWPGLSAP
jgi:hypothetical protein